MTELSVFREAVRRIFLHQALFVSLGIVTLPKRFLLYIPKDLYCSSFVFTTILTGRVEIESIIQIFPISILVLIRFRFSDLFQSKDGLERESDRFDLLLRIFSTQIPSDILIYRYILDSRSIHFDNIVQAIRKADICDGIPIIASVGSIAAW